MARLTAQLTNSYLVTDLPSRWKEIELDRSGATPETEVWSPFAKAFESSPLRCLNALSLNHALTLRHEKRLDSMRGFLHRVWKQARSPEVYSASNISLLTEQLRDEINKAEHEWRSIDADLLKRFGTALAAGVAGAGSLIAQGYGTFLAAGAAVTGAVAVGTSLYDRARFTRRSPAAFFLNLENK